MKSLGFLLLFLFLFTSCSTKEKFSPEQITGKYDNYIDLKEQIVETSKDGAQYSDGFVITKDTIVDLNISNKRFLSTSNGYYIYSDYNGTISLVNVNDLSDKKDIALKKTIATASVKDNLLAVLFANNDIALYDITDQSLLFKEQGGTSVIVDNRIAEPYFLNDLVVFLTLDGKLVIVNSTSKKTVKSIIVSSNDTFNNVIYFSVLDNNLVAATNTKLLSLSNKERRVDYNIRDVVFKDDIIYLSTKEGEVISLTPSLQLISRNKFPFAHFVGLVVDENSVYLLEKEGYFIVLNRDLTKYKVYKAPFDIGKVFTSNNKIFVKDRVFYTSDANKTIK